MIVTSELTAGIVFLNLTGRLDAVTATHFAEQCRPYLQSTSATVALNCHALEYISSAGLRAILELNRIVQESSGKLVICSPRSPVSDVLAMSGFSSLVPIYSSTEAVLDAR